MCAEDNMNKRQFNSRAGEKPAYMQGKDTLYGPGGRMDAQKRPKTGPMTTGPKHEAPAIGSQAREATAAPYHGKHREKGA